MLLRVLSHLVSSLFFYVRMKKTSDTRFISLEIRFFFFFIVMISSVVMFYFV